MLGLGSQAQLGLGIAVILQDRFSANAQKVVSSMQAMKKASNSMMDQIARNYQQSQMRMATATGLASYGMYQLAKDGANLSHKVTQTLVIGGKGLGKSREEIKSMMHDITQEFAQMPEGIGDALLDNVRAGVKGSLRELTRYQTAAASIVGEPLGGEQGVGTGILSGMFTFDLPIIEKNIARFTDAIVSGANQSKASVRSITEGLKYSGFTFRQMGFTPEQAIAYAAKMAQSGIEGSSQGVAANQMLLEMTRAAGVSASPKKKAALARLGIEQSTLKSYLDQGKLFEAVGLIDAAASRMASATERNVAIFDLLGVRGAKAGLGGFGSTVKGQSLQDFIGGIYRDQATGITLKQAHAVAKDPYSDIMRAEAAWANFKMEFVETIAPQLHIFTGFLTSINEGLSSFSKTKVGTVLMNFVAIALPTLTVMAGFRAAMIGATFALKGWTVNSKIGGFTGIMKGLLGATGLSGAGAYGALKRNVAGQWYVRAGQTFTHPTTGFTYKGGRRIPASAFPTSSFGPLGTSMMGASMLQSGTLGKIGTFVGKAGSTLGKIASTGLSMLPIVGTVFTIGTLVADIFGWLKSSDTPENPADQEFDANKYFSKQLQEALYGTKQSGAPGLLNPNNPYGEKIPPRNQQIVINNYVDGDLQNKKQITIDPNSAFNNFDVQLVH